MKQFWLQIIALLVVIFGGLWVSVNPNALGSLTSTSPTLPIGSTSSTEKVSIVSPGGESKVVVNVEIADTPQKRAQGLGDRDKLDPNSGMLFIFEQPTVPQFWMKGVKFPIDIIWIKGDQVAGIAENVPPPPSTPGEVLPIYSPAAQVDKVLEVNGGFARVHNIVVGDKLQQVQ